MQPQAPSRIDFHSHTSRSDGVLPPLRLLDEMAALGMSTVAISDHDTLAAYREIRGAGRTDGPPLVLPAIEINSVAPEIPGLPEGELHILGLGVDPDDARLETALQRQREARAARIAMIVDRLAEIGRPIDEHLSATLPADVASAGRPHLARALIRAGHAANVPDAFDKFLSPGRPGFIARIGMGPRAAIDFIRGAGGIPVLAHFPEAPELPEVIRQLRGWGLAGLEVYYAKFSPAVVADMAACAAEHELLPTCGSDFHGDTLSYAETLALAPAPPGVAEAVLAAIGDVAGRWAPGEALRRPEAVDVGA